jgi:hypothetical protein
MGWIESPLSKGICSSPFLLPDGLEHIPFERGDSIQPMLMNELAFLT